MAGELSQIADHFRDQLIAASLKPLDFLEGVFVEREFPRSIDRGLIEARSRR